MKNLTKSDLLNIEAFKGLINMVSNDIKDVKNSKATTGDKAAKIMQLYRQRIQLISQASEKYSHINWLDEAIGTDNGFNRSLIETVRMKIDMKFNFN